MWWLDYWPLWLLLFVMSLIGVALSISRNSDEDH
jgi:hypothetical protein